MSFQIETDHLAMTMGSEWPNKSGRLFDGPLDRRWGALVETLPLPATDDAGQVLPRIPFRLFDDDGKLYYEGWLHDDWNCDNQLAALMWAGADSGCTSIKVLRGEDWQEEIA